MDGLRAAYLLALAAILAAGLLVAGLYLLAASRKRRSRRYPPRTR